MFPTSSTRGVGISSSIGVVAKKTTHHLRKSTAQHVGANNIDGDHNKTAGHWLNSALIKYYLSPFPFKFIHHVTGFQRDEPYHIARDIDPPEELKRMIFPHLEEWVSTVENRTDQAWLEPQKRDDAILDFLHMLQTFRSVLIQDLAAWMEFSSESIFCTHEITKHPLFIEFRTRLRQATERNLILCDLSFKTEIYKFSKPIVTVLNALKNGIERGFESIRRDLKEILVNQQESSDLRQKESRELNKLLAEAQECLYTLNQSGAVMIAELRSSRKEVAILRAEITEIKCILKEKTSFQDVGISAITWTDEQPVVGEILDQQTGQSVPGIDPNDPQFKLLDSATVKAVLDEWYISTPTRMSIASREAVYKSDWRPEHSANASFRRKKSVVNFLEKHRKTFGHEPMTVRQFGRILEAYRAVRGWTLAGLVKKRLELKLGQEKTAEALSSMWNGLSPETRTAIIGGDDLAIIDHHKAEILENIPQLDLTFDAESATKKRKITENTQN
ncbi:hypothetical protein JCM33374_g3340 [Metschnikowia sp. JCM 33374]|nr:hypothetical protein JCM33374_g3340 [Metschnikowia sp. JCM 33374]